MVNQLERAFRTWPVLARCAASKKLITYGELGEEIGVHHRAIRYILGHIQDYCLESNLPPLTILIINASGLPGAGFIAYDLENFDEGLEKVYGFDWGGIENPFDLSSGGDSMESLVEELLESPESSGEVYARVKARGLKQMVFRKALLKAYSRRCAFTEISILETLEASHIIPWSQASSDEKLDVRNGILLNRFHHKLFDIGHMTISDDWHVIYKQSNSSVSDVEINLTSNLDGRKMHLPRLKVLRPKKEYIEKHNDIVGWNLSE